MSDTDKYEWAERVARLRADLDAANARADAAIREAQTWKQEAMTQRATVHAAYEVCTGKTGEPGDWNGAEPIRALAARADELLVAGGALADRVINLALPENMPRHLDLLMLDEDAKRFRAVAAREAVK